MSNKMDLIFQEVLQKINVEEDKQKFMQENLDRFLLKLNSRKRKLKIDVEFFVGGSFAKKTMIKKGVYDVDLFLRFNKKYPQENYSKLVKKILKFTFGVKKVKGSREYFQVKINNWFKIEVIPVRKISKSKEAENITDLSYSHVQYINKKVKQKKVIEGIKLAKAFTHAINVYGAESYIHGFSGYSLELLVYYYGSFEKMLKTLSKPLSKKLVIDIENLYKKGNVLLDMNGSKLESPIILVDPTLKERNVLAALSYEKFEIFQEKAREFLKKPSIDFFKIKRIDLNLLKSNSLREGYEFIIIKTKTKKQSGDIAGTKLLKFHRTLVGEIDKFFEIKQEGFDYLDEKYGRNYFIVKRRNEILFTGPKENDKKHSLKFREEHKKVFVKSGKLYSKEKFNLTIKDFLEKWKIKNKRKIKEMYVSKFIFN